MLVHEALIREYGHREWRRHRDPLSELIFTILSQNTSDVNRDRACRQLIERFPTWEAVRDADVEEIAAAIRPGGLANIKAPRIKNILQTITERCGGLSLDFLADMSVEEAKEWLGSLKGVGPKTVACVLLFSCGKPVLPVDTHVYRVSKRLGLIPPKASAAKAHSLLEEMLPDEAIYDFHLNMIAHGRQVCKSQKPRCDACVLAGYCDYVNTRAVDSAHNFP